MTALPFISYAHQSIDSSDIQEVVQALASEMITRGPQVKAFEEAIASYCGAKYGVAFNSGTTALFASCHAAGLGPSDRFITTPNTFVASVGPAITQKATPIFIDIDRKNGNFNLNQLEFNLNLPSTRGKTFVVPVHFAGIALDMQALDNMIKNPETVVIEDAAHALGSHYPDGQKVGSCAWSQMTIFSFHPAKNITTGEGGMVMTNSDELYARLRLYRDNGIQRSSQPGYYEVEEITGGFHFTEMQAALGMSQLKRLNQFILKRRELMSAYRKQLAGIPHLTMFSPEYDHRTAYHLCVVQIDFEEYRTTRVAVMEKLKEEGIGTQVHYIPVYLHPFFTRQAGDISEYFPETQSYYAQALTLPLHFNLEEIDVKRVVDTLKRILN